MMKISFMVACILATHSVYSQQEGTIETHEIKIVKDYNVFIEEATKIILPITYKPQFQDKSSQKKLTYQLPDRIEEFKFDPSAITPIPYKSKISFFKNNNFLKLGAGTLLNPIVEWSHQDLNSKNPLKINLNHNSAWLGNRDMQKFSESDLIVETIRSLGIWKLQPKLNAEHRIYNFYGNIPESNYQSTSNRNYIHGGLSVDLNKESSENKSLSIYNTIGIQYGQEGINWLATMQRNNEFNFNASVKGIYKFSDNTQFILQTGLETYQIDYVARTKKFNATISPGLSYKNKTLRVLGGLNFVSATVNEDDDIYFLPKLHTEVQLVPGLLNLYTIWERTIELNMLHTTIQANPFATFSNGIIPNSLVENRLAGIKGTLKDFNYNAYLHQRIVKDALLFANDNTNPRYLMSQVEKNFRVNSLSMELSYLKMEQWDFYLKGDLFLYELDNLPVAYNLPGQKLSLATHYKPSSKWLIQTQLYLIGGVKSLINNIPVVSNIALDLNLATEYQINKKFYIFANINNVLNSKIIQQIGYPSYGVNGQLGFRVLY